MKFTSDTTIPFAAEQIDLAGWFFALSDEEFQATARGHRALGRYVEDGVRGVATVETVGGNLLIHHFLQMRASRSLVEVFSEQSTVYIMRIFPVAVPVRLTLATTPKNAGQATFSCSLEVDLPAPIRILSSATGGIGAIRRLTREETVGFASDISCKLEAVATRSDAVERSRGAARAQ